ncbi:MAG: hypothetical protein MUO76_11290 [Anaerolineaceae bacterium]|nr:hypothetical protein [Anaerolineaceae bacterium]
MKSNNMGTSHRRQTIRLPGYDYTQPGAYFITICTYEKTCLFGEISECEIRLSHTGQIAQNEWLRLNNRFQHINLDEFIIMPNHIHAIITILCEGTADVRTDTGQSNSRRASTGEQFGKPVPGSIPTIIRSYKSSVTQRVK